MDTQKSPELYVSPGTTPCDFNPPWLLADSGRPADPRLTPNKYLGTDDRCSLRLLCDIHALLPRRLAG